MTELGSLIDAMTTSQNGITGQIYLNYDYTSIAVANTFLRLFAIVALVLLVLWFLSWAFKIIYPKSKEYRELLTDMYVAGKIKKIAAKDEIDLSQELKEYISIVKKSNLSSKSLDSAIEAHLRERIAEDEEKAKEG